LNKTNLKYARYTNKEKKIENHEFDKLKSLQQPQEYFRFIFFFTKQPFPQNQFCGRV